MLKKLGVLFIALTLSMPMLATASIVDQPMTANRGNIGDLLLYPLYDVRPGIEDRSDDGWENYIAIENTSGFWTACHLRFRSWRTSAEVYDHIILLSPYDVWYATIYNAMSSGTTSTGYQYDPGDVIITSADKKTCLYSGLTFNANDIWVEKFQDFLLDDIGLTGDMKAEMQAGHIEIVGLWQLRPDTIPGEARNALLLHNPAVNGVPDMALLADNQHDLTKVVDDVYNDGFTGNINVYDVLEALYWEQADPNYAGGYLNNGWVTGGVNTAWNVQPASVLDIQIEDTENNGTGINVDRYGIDCPNVLTATFDMGDVNTARYQTANFMAIQNFRTPAQNVAGGGFLFANCATANLPGAGTEMDNWVGPAAAAGPYTTNGAGVFPAQHFEQSWTHRDGFPGGAIIHTTDIMKWQPTYENPFYVNESWATTVGAGLRDGENALAGNTMLEIVADAAAPVAGPANYVHSNPTPINRYFNDSWSLDELEALLIKAEIWSHYFTQVTTGGAKGGFTLDTDMILTFPTKHYHFFFRDWPVFEQNPVANIAYDVTTNYSSYWAALAAYRKDPSPNTGAVTTGWETEDYSIAYVLEKVYQWGAVSGTPVVWDMEENPTGAAPATVPPGSPWTPTAPTVGVIPNEVNIISVRNNTGTGINAGNWLINPDTYTQGHFRVTGITLNNGARAFNSPGNLYDTTNGDNYQLAVEGMMIFTHTDKSTANAFIRSTMAPWKFR